jgi:hypothetical protein
LKSAAMTRVSFITSLWLGRQAKAKNKVMLKTPKKTTADEIAEMIAPCRTTKVVADDEIGRI